MSASSSVEYQAIILATGVGASLFPLTSSDSVDEEPHSTTTPGKGGSSSSASSSSSNGESIGRSVLPIANRPLLWYQLDMIHRAGFPTTLVVTRDTMKKSVQRCCEEWRVARGGVAQSDSGASSMAPQPSPSSSSLGLSSTPLLDIEVFSCTNYQGTADALRQVSSKIHTDFFVLSGALISNLPFQNLADLARSQDAGMVMAVYEEPEATDLKERKKIEAESAAAGADSQYFGIDSSNQRLLLFQNQADVEESLQVSKKLLATHPRFTLHTRIKDAHLYLFSQWILYFLREKPSITSIQSELVPCLVSGQFKAKYAQWKGYGKNKLQQRALCMSHAPRKELELNDSSILASAGASVLSLPQLDRTSSLGDHAHTMSESSSMNLAMLANSSSMADLQSLVGSTPGANNGRKTHAPHSLFSESFRLFVYHLGSNTFCMRANTLTNYKNLNHELCSDREYPYTPWPSVSLDNCAESIAKQFSTQVIIGRETVIGEGTTFAGETPQPTTTVKRSCIGRNCAIAQKNKIQNCIIMDGVQIGEGCNLTDCLISSGAVIGANCILKDCKIAPKFHVSPGTEGKNEDLCQEVDEE